MTDPKAQPLTPSLWVDLNKVAARVAEAFWGPGAEADDQARELAHAAVLSVIEQQRKPVESYACQRCGRADGLDAVVPDDVWAKLSERAGGVNLLCLWCIDQLGGEIGWAGSVSLHFAGRHIYGSSQSDADSEHINRLCASVAKLEAALAERGEEAEDAAFFHVDGEEHCDKGAALAELLRAEVVFPNQRPYTYQGEPAGDTVVVYVNSSDIFAWACADGEDLPLSEVGPLLKLYRAQNFWGVVRWCCLRRNEKPQPAVERDMRKAGFWGDDMEALPENAYGRFCRERSALSGQGQQKGGE